MPLWPVNIMKIDIFNHIVTPRYRDARLKIAPPQMRLEDQGRVMPVLFDLEARFRAMDTAGDGYLQILTMANPPVETFAGPGDALDPPRECPAPRGLRGSRPGEPQGTGAEHP